MALEKALYTGYTTITAGRDGRAEASDGSFDVGLGIPQEMGGDGREGTNPEQLFGAAYGACFLSAMGSVAKKHDTRLPGDASIEAAVTIGKQDDNMQLEVEFHISLPGIDNDTASKLIEEAHEVCPYSRATRNNVDVSFKLKNKA